MKEREQPEPTIIDEINAEFKKNSEFTVEQIAENLGISKKALDSWLGDLQFNRELEGFLESKKTLSPDDEDEEWSSKADATMVAFILIGARERRKGIN